MFVHMAQILHAHGILIMGRLGLSLFYCIMRKDGTLPFCVQCWVVCPSYRPTQNRISRKEVRRNPLKLLEKRNISRKEVLGLDRERVAVLCSMLWINNESKS